MFFYYFLVSNTKTHVLKHFSMDMRTQNLFSNKTWNSWVIPSLYVNTEAFTTIVAAEGNSTGTQPSMTEMSTKSYWSDLVCTDLVCSHVMRTWKTHFFSQIFWSPGMKDKDNRNIEVLYFFSMFIKLRTFYITRRKRTFLLRRLE